MPLNPKNSLCAVNAIGDRETPTTSRPKILREYLTIPYQPQFNCRGVACGDRVLRNTYNLCGRRKRRPYNFNIYYNFAYNSMRVSNKSQLILRMVTFSTEYYTVGHLVGDPERSRRAEATFIPIGGSTTRPTVSIN